MSLIRNRFEVATSNHVNIVTSICLTKRSITLRPKRRPPQDVQKAAHLLAKRYVLGVSIKDLAIHTREFLVNNCKTLDLHMVGRFPFNSCETTSLLLGKAISNKYPSKEVLFVDGHCKNGKGRHFWIEADGLCFDLTADQFNNIQRPFYGVAHSEHSNYFLADTKSNLVSELDSNSFYTSKTEQFDSAIKNITSALNGTKTVG